MWDDLQQLWTSLAEFAVTFRHGFTMQINVPVDKADEDHLRECKEKSFQAPVTGKQLFKFIERNGVHFRIR